MWIRSQEKTKLLKVEIVEYCSGLGIYVNGQRCAKYSTEQKTLKVLDMIEEHLEKMYIGTSNYMGKPFQMPQDEEVL